MPTPTPTATRTDPRHSAERRAAPPRPIPVAQQVWLRALTLVDPLAQHDVVALALDLLRNAHHDPVTLSAALALGRAHVRAHPDDVTADGGVKVLERAIAFLGMKPRGRR